MIPDDDEDTGMAAALVGMIVVAVIIALAVGSIVLLCKMTFPP